MEFVENKKVSEVVLIRRLLYGNLTPRTLARFCISV